MKSRKIIDQAMREILSDPEVEQEVKDALSKLLGKNPEIIGHPDGGFFVCIAPHLFVYANPSETKAPLGG